MLGKRCLHFTERAVPDYRELRRRTVAHSRVREHSETRVDPESIGLCQESKVYYPSNFEIFGVDNTG